MRIFDKILRRPKPPEPGERIAISAGNHKDAALTFDRIVPMHSEKSVPIRFRTEFVFAEETKPAVRICDAIARSPLDAPTIPNVHVFLQIAKDYSGLFDTQNNPISQEQARNNSLIGFVITRRYLCTN
jgi:hypothetical protein